MLMCIIAGGNIDLSVGSVVALVGALAGVLIVNLKLNIYLSILICLLVGLLLGAWQAFWIAYMRIPPFIVTLAGMLTFRGLAWSTLDGKTISPFPMEFTRFFNSYIPASGGATLTVSIIVGAVICAMFVVMQLVTRASKAKKGYQVDAVPLAGGKAGAHPRGGDVGILAFGSGQGHPGDFDSAGRGGAGVQLLYLEHRAGALPVRNGRQRKGGQAFRREHKTDPVFRLYQHGILGQRCRAGVCVPVQLGGAQCRHQL